MASMSKIAQGAESGHHCRTCACHSTSTGHTSEAALSSRSSEGSVYDMDQEIVRVHDLLVTLKKRRNTLLAIARIPPELLSEMFLYFRDTSIPPTSEHWTNVPWISITHVSAHWRAVALADPRLWNVLNLRFPDLVRHFSGYSAKMPLRTILSFSGLPYTRDDEHLDDIPDYLLGLNNIVSLEICASDEEAGLVLDDILDQAKNTLLYLVIRLNPVEYGEIETLDQYVTIPNLRSLSLDLLSFAPAGPLFTSCSDSLRELKIRNCDLCNWPGKEIECLVRLERLWLVHCDGYELFDVEQIFLPALAELRVENSLDTCLEYLRAFSLPPGCHLVISSELPEYEEDEEDDDEEDDEDDDTMQEIISLISSVHPNHACVYIAKDFIELRYEGVHDICYVLKLVYDSQDISGLRALANILPLSTTTLSIACHVDARHGTPKVLTVFEDLQSLSVCGPFSIISLLNNKLQEDETLLRNLTLIRVCECNAADGQILSKSWEFREGLDVGIGRADLCCCTYKCVD